jgi:hypothetical protein
MPEAERVLGAASAASAGPAVAAPPPAPVLPGPAVFSHSQFITTSREKSSSASMA